VKTQPRDWRSLRLSAGGVRRRILRDLRGNTEKSRAKLPRSWRIFRGKAVAQINRHTAADGNESKFAELCAASDAIESGIFERFRVRPAQNRGVLHEKSIFSPTVQNSARFGDKRRAINNSARQFCTRARFQIALNKCPKIKPLRCRRLSHVNCRHGRRAP
jgi:hypothetical protein